MLAVSLLFGCKGALSTLGTYVACLTSKCLDLCKGQGPTQYLDVLRLSSEAFLRCFPSARRFGGVLGVWRKVRASHTLRIRSRMRGECWDVALGNRESCKAPDSPIS